MLHEIVPLADGGSDSHAIQTAIDRAVAEGINCVRIPPKRTDGGITHWEIDRTILLPSNITVILDNCHLRLKDGVYENIFRNKNVYDSDTYTIEQEQRGIHIQGIGEAVLDGGNANGLCEANSEKNGLPNVRSNNLILLHNVNGYTLDGFKLINQRYWAINQLFCRNGRLSNLSFYNGVFGCNQDGINLRIGCSDILIENISGRTGDDTIALSAFLFTSDTCLCVRGKTTDIHDVTIRNVQASTLQTIVALRNSDGAKIHNVVIENVADVESVYTPWAVVRIGENNYYKDHPSLLGETSDIHIRDIHSRGAAAIFLAGSLMNSHISDVYASGGTMHAISTYMPQTVSAENNCVVCGGIDMKNVLIENIFYSGTAAYCDDARGFSGLNRYTYSDVPFRGCALDFRCMRETDRMDNVVMRGIFADSPSKPAMFREGYEQAVSL